MNTSYVEPRNFIDALIPGVGVRSQALGTKCEAALRAFGGRVIGYVRAAAAEAPPRRRKQLDAFASTIDETQEVSPNAVFLVRKALVCATGARTNRPNSDLIPVLRVWGPEMMDRLVREAFLNRSKPTVCLRMLEVFEQLGGSCGDTAWQELLQLSLTTKNSAVREMANRFVWGSAPSVRFSEPGVSA